MVRAGPQVPVDAGRDPVQPLVGPGEVRGGRGVGPPRAEAHLARAQQLPAAEDGGVRVMTASGDEVSAERLLVATGRHSDTSALDLAAAGVDTDERGYR